MDLIGALNKIVQKKYMLAHKILFRFTHFNLQLISLCVDSSDFASKERRQPKF